MYSIQMTSAYRRMDLMRDAERQHLADFVTCCTQSSWFRSLGSAARRVTLLLQRASAPQTACASCPA